MENINFAEIFASNQKTFLIFGALIVFTIIFNIVRMRSIKNKAGAFADKNPNAAKLYLSTKAVQVTEPVQVTLVNDDHPVFFMDGTKSGVYLSPGVNKLNISYVYSKPGIVHKQVTTTYGPVDINFEAEARGNYLVTFNRKQEIFEFEEI